MSAIWLHDDNASLIAFYGDPFSRVFAQNLVPFTPLWRMYFKDSGKVAPVRQFVVHRKCFDALTRIFASIWNGYAHNQPKIEALNLHWYGGCYAPRNVRGSDSKLSCHAFAAAIDLDPEHEPMNRAHKSNMPQLVIDAFKAEGAFWAATFARARTRCISNSQPNSRPLRKGDIYMPINLDQVLSAVRWLITTAGAYFVTKGSISGDQVNLIAGAGAAIASLVWSFFVHADSSTPPGSTPAGT